MRKSDPALVELTRWAAEYCHHRRQEKIEARFALDESAKSKAAPPDPYRRRRIAAAVKAAAAHYAGATLNGDGLTDEQLAAEVIRRDPSLKPAGRPDWWRELVAEVCQVAKENGVPVTEKNHAGDDRLTQEVMRQRAREGGAPLSLAPMTDDRRRAVVDEQMRNADRYGYSRG